MKQCPQCLNIYADDTLNFCLEDGLPLVFTAAESNGGPTTLHLSNPRNTAETHVHRLQNSVFQPNQTPSIAVLPFSNMSNDAENEYFCDGLAEEILNALAKIDKLRVAARTSTFALKNKNAGIDEISRTLKVAHILEGSVRKSGNRVRITAQLIKASDGYHLWSERYDREMKDIFDVQDEITIAIVEALKIKLLEKEKPYLSTRYTDNTEAYELFLKGRYYLHKHTAETWLKAIRYFENSIKIAPEYAPAYAGLSTVLSYSWFFGLRRPQEVVENWKAVTARALELDNDLDEAHTANARLQFFYEWNWEEAEKEYLRALELNPNNAEVHHQYGVFLVSLERFDEAIRAGIKALELDPLSILVNFQVAWIYVFSGQFDEAIKLQEKMIEIAPYFHGAYSQMGLAFVGKGLYEEALDAYRKALTLSNHQNVLSSLAAIYAFLGRKDEALDILDSLFDLRKQQPISALNIARVYNGLGENDKAIEWLETAVEERNGELVFLNVETKAGSGKMFGGDIRQDARFAGILQKIGFPDSR